MAPTVIYGLTSIKGEVPVHAMRACKGSRGVAPFIPEKKCVG